MDDLVTRELLHRARRWVRANQCQLPLDLTQEMLGHGLDAGAIEDQLLEERDFGN